MMNPKSKLFVRIVFAAILFLGIVRHNIVDALTLPLADECQYIILSEDFEDDILNPQISIETTGSFNSNPGIKTVANFGSTRAFGYGRSTCGASCFDSHVTNFKITLSEPTYVSHISFKEMELYSNWGSKGKIYIDGNPITWGDYNANEDFGRQPSNDYTADTQYRLQNYSINKYVTTIELKVADITNSSEIFIDDLKICGQACQPPIHSIIWRDTFEDYTPETFPSLYWTVTGSSDVHVNNSKSAVGNQSLRVHGSVGGCWESIPHRWFNVSKFRNFTIQFYIYIDSDHWQGCHSWAGGAGLHTTDDWTTAEGVGIITFLYDGSITSRIGSLGTYAWDTWYKVKMQYDREDDSTVELSYWIDDVYKGSKSVSAASYEDDLRYFHLSSGDGTIWADEIEVYKHSDSVVMDIPKGWSMISLPVDPADKRLQTVFPNAVVAYGYEKGRGYIRVTPDEELEVGKGYWILLDQAQSYTLTGCPILSYTHQASSDGWAMIGGCMDSAQVLPEGCDVGVIYGYTQGVGYQQVTGHLEPGKGYWILLNNVASGEGTISVETVD